MDKSIIKRTDNEQTGKQNQESFNIFITVEKGFLCIAIYIRELKIISTYFRWWRDRLNTKREEREEINLENNR